MKTIYGEEFDFSELQDVSHLITTNIKEISSGKDYTAKLFVDGRLISESISIIVTENDRKFLTDFIMRRNRPVFCTDGLGI